jgi:hypothetical protein
VFEEIGLPGGKVTIHQWWKAGQFAFYKKVRRDLIAKDETISKVVKRPAKEFEKFLDLILKADNPPIKNIASGIRDGVMYSISWGDIRKNRYVGISNPVSDSRHGHFIQMFKLNTWSPDPW